METNFYPVDQLVYYRLYNTIPENKHKHHFKTINNKVFVNLNSCATWLKKD